MMRSLLMCALIASLTFGLASTPAEAKRLGGGKSYGVQRNTPDKPAPGTPATPAATPNAPAAAAAPTAGAAAAAAAPKRSWMGPLAGLAAGLGLAALLGHFGLGAEFANFLMLALMAVVAVFAIRWLMRRFAGGNARGLAFAGANGADGGSASGGYRASGTGVAAGSATPTAASSLGAFKTAEPAALPGSAAATWSANSTSAAGTTAGSFQGMSVTSEPAARLAALPAGFDTTAFERIAKLIFIRMQAANDSADLNDLRSFTTPELFAALRLDLQERGTAPQATDVVSIEATMLDYAEEDDRQIVSVQFQGLVREEAGAEAAPIDEIWHLTKPLDGSRAWVIAGVQQRR